jgi:hypothetical protein
VQALADMHDTLVRTALVAPAGVAGRLRLHPLFGIHRSASGVSLPDAPT